MRKPFRILLHGGTDNYLSSAPREEVVKLALTLGRKILAADGASTDAVQAVVEVLEDSGVFNAGKGSVFNAEGFVEQDACIMDGKTLMASGVGALQKVKNPIRVAAHLLQQGKTVLLVGEGARKFALSKDLQVTDTSYYVPSKSSQEPKKYYGTVGAVALDTSGHLASATSSGGMENKPLGRLGDSPIAGAGTYANDLTCAVSATGMGEMFLRANLGFRIGAAMEFKGISLEDASILALNHVQALGGVGGLIALDRQKNICVLGNAFVEAAWTSEDEQIHFTKAKSI